MTKRTGMAIALILLAALLVIGGVMYFNATLQPSSDLLRDTVMTRAAGAGQTAVYEFRLTEWANP